CVLVAALGMDRLVGRKLDQVTRYVDRLSASAHEMHLDAAPLAVVERPMAERVDIEVRQELAIDAREQIEVELGGHARGIVIGGIENVGVLDEIDTDDKRCACPQHAPGMA